MITQILAGRRRRKSLQGVQGTANGQAGGKGGDQGDQYDLAEDRRVAGPPDRERAEQGADLVLARRSLEPAAQEVSEAEHQQRGSTADYAPLQPEQEEVPLEFA